MIHQKRTKPVFDVKSLLMRELAMRLTYLHGQEIIHLNRGSRTILLTRVLKLKLADFCCARKVNVQHLKMFCSESHAGDVSLLQTSQSNRIQATISHCNKTVIDPIQIRHFHFKGKIRQVEPAKTARATLLEHVQKLFAVPRTFHPSNFFSGPKR